MNQKLQSKFEKKLFELKLIKDRRVLNKDYKGIYTNDTTWMMYRIWINREAKLEKLKKKLDESFMCGYTEAESKFLPIIKKLKEDVK